MPDASSAFTIAETHGMLRQPGVQKRVSSDDRGWSSIYASMQRELPFEASFKARVDPLIVLNWGAPVMLHQRIRKGEHSGLIPSGGLVMTPGGMDFGIRVGSTVHTIHLYLRRALIGEVADDIVIGDPVNLEILPRFGDSDPLIERLMFGVGDALRDDDPAAMPYVDYLGRAIAARLIRQHSSVSVIRQRGRISEVMANNRLSRTLEFIEANLAQPVGLPAMADAAGLSASHFARQFRATTGEAPHQYLVQRRVALAKRRLEATDASIAEVAFECGFANQEHLTRVFKRFCGATPGAYRKDRRA
jgi:AraC family transcriptional regulator